MPRKAQVRYFASRKGYYCQHQGRQYRLADGPDDAPAGPTYLAALEAFRQLMQMGAVHTSKDRNTVRVVLETYLQHAKEKMQPRTFQRRVSQFALFCDVHGETPVGDLTHFVLEEFCLKMKNVPRPGKGRTYRWTDGSVRLFLTTALAAFKWGIKRKLITLNPVDGIEVPARRSRSRECLISPEQHRRILAACTSRHLRPIIVCLEATGCRQGELLNASAADWDEDLRALHYYGDDTRREDEFRHKAAGEQKDRVIFFGGEALAVIRELLVKHPTGRLFRTRRDRPWTTSMLCMGFRKIGTAVGMLKLSPHSYRHTFATNWLKSGRSIDVLAEILGNTPETIRRHYAHLCGDRQTVRKHFEDFRNVEVEKRTESPQP